MEIDVSQENKITLSLIICSRNDNYMGDPMWRLATSINYVSRNIYDLNRESEIEIVVADWGSEVPIAKVIRLTEQACAITRFIHVPPSRASELQKDSPFAEVYALNLAARRCKGQYIGRIDQDTLVTGDFITCFFDVHEGRSKVNFDLENSYLFAARKQLPYSFVAQKPTIKDLKVGIERFGQMALSEELSYCYWASAVGILMMHKNMWDDIGGYDERLIYYWFMDVDLATRLIKKYSVVNIGREFGYHFFHLEHIKPRFQFRHSHRKLNPAWSKSFDKPVLNPNGNNWGLADEVFSESQITATENGSGLSKLNILNNNKALFSLAFQTVLMSLKGYLFGQIRYLRYCYKRLLSRPYL